MNIEEGFKTDNWMSNKDKIKRLFTVMVDKHQNSYCEFLTLSLQCLEQMSYEFMDSYRHIMDSAYLRMQRSLLIK